MVVGTCRFRRRGLIDSSDNSRNSPLGACGDPGVALPRAWGRPGGGLGRRGSGVVVGAAVAGETVGEIAARWATRAVRVVVAFVMASGVHGSALVLGLAVTWARYRAVSRAGG